MTRDETALLTTLLEAEHAAVYAYGTLGARLAGPELGQARQALDAHRDRRGQLVGLLRDAGAPIPATRPAYDVAVSGRVSALALAVRLEEGLALRWSDLVGGTDAPALRSLAARGLADSAVRAARWRTAAGVRPATVPLPGSA
jgi:Domain of unknown function (DUF4439)